MSRVTEVTERNDAGWTDAVPDPKVWQYAAEILNNMLTCEKKLTLTAGDVLVACVFAELEFDGSLERKPKPDGTYVWKRVK